MSKPRKKKKTKTESASDTNFWFEFEADDQVDLHGFAIDEALMEVEHRIKALKQGGYRSLRIIHGQPKAGQNSIFTALQRKLNYEWSSLIHSFFTEPHNLGATIVMVKE